MIRRPFRLALPAVAIVAAGALLGPAAARPLKPEQEAQIRPAGKAQSCIAVTQIDHTDVRSDQVIDFYMRGRTVYRVRLPQPCPELGFEERFAYATPLTQLCSTDIVTVLREAPLSRGASCGLGEFQPITGAPRF